MKSSGSGCCLLLLLALVMGLPWLAGVLFGLMLFYAAIMAIANLGRWWQTPRTEPTLNRRQVAIVMLQLTALALPAPVIIALAHLLRG